MTCHKSLWLGFVCLCFSVTDTKNKLTLTHPGSMVKFCGPLTGSRFTPHSLNAAVPSTFWEPGDLFGNFSEKEFVFQGLCPWGGGGRAVVLYGICCFWWKGYQSEAELKQWGFFQGKAWVSLLKKTDKERKTRAVANGGGDLGREEHLRLEGGNVHFLRSLQYQQFSILSYKIFVWPW